MPVKRNVRAGSDIERLSAIQADQRGNLPVFGKPLTMPVESPPLIADIDKLKTCRRSKLQSLLSASRFRGF